MATATAPTSQSYWSIRLEAWESSWSVSDNTSVVEYAFYLDANGGSISNRQLTRSVTIDNATMASRTAPVSVASVGSALLESGSLVVPHNSDGSKTVTVSASISQSGTWTHPIGSASISLSLQLTNIPRASQPSINTHPQNSPRFTIGDTITIYTNRVSSAFTHAVVFNYGSSSVAVATGVTDSVTYNTSNIAASLLALCLNSDSYQGTITVRTYNGSALVGENTCSYTAVVPASNKPAVSVTSVTDRNAATATLTGTATKMIKGYSNPRIVISASQSDSNTALARAVLKCGSADPIQKTLSGVSGTATFDLTGIAEASVTITVYDRRGRYTTITQSWTLINYIPPTISLAAARLTGNLDKVSCSVSGQGWKGSFGAATNSLTINFYYKLKSSSGSASQSSTSKTVTPTTQNQYSTSATLAETFASANEYTVYAVVSDLLVSSIQSATVQIYQALPSAVFFKQHFDVFGTLHVHDRSNPNTVGHLTATDINALLQMLGSPIVFKTTSKTITTPSNDGADVTWTFDSAMPSSAYWVGITPSGNPNGFDQVGYTVSSRTAAAVTIHSWNSYSAPVTQTLLLCVIDIGGGRVRG